MFRSARPRVTPAAATTAPKIPKVTMLLAVPPLVAEKKSEQQGDRTKLPGGRTRDRQLAENGLQLARVLKDGDDEPEGRGGQGDGEKERIADPPHRMEGGACDGPEQQRAGKPGERSAELTGGRRPEVDLQPGQEEQKGQAKQRHHIDRLIDLQPSQDGRPDDNPGDDLHDGAWQLTRRTDAVRMGAATAIALIISSPLNLIVLMGRTPSGATARSATSSYRRMPVTRPAMGDDARPRSPRA
jgi:hypothetical protein